MGGAASEKDSSGAQVIISVTTEGGIRSAVCDLVAVPVFTLYEGGKVLYTACKDRNGLCTLMEARLTPQEVADLLMRLEKAGFFEMDETYQDCPLPDMPTTRISVNTSQKKSVSIYAPLFAIKSGLLPEGLARIYQELTGFSHPSAKKFEPNQILLFARRLDPGLKKGAGRIVKWHPKIDLTFVCAQAEKSGYGRVVLEGGDAQKVSRALEETAPYSSPGAGVIFRQKKEIFSLAWRPVLPHEKFEKTVFLKPEPSKKTEDEEPAPAERTHHK